MLLGLELESPTTFQQQVTTVCLYMKQILPLLKTLNTLLD